MKEAIEYLLHESKITNYQISKATGISQQVLSKYSNKTSDIENMTFGNALKLYEYCKKCSKMYFYQNKLSLDIEIWEMDKIIKFIKSLSSENVYDFSKTENAAFENTFLKKLAKKIEEKINNKNVTKGEINYSPDENQREKILLKFNAGNIKDDKYYVRVESKIHLY